MKSRVVATADEPATAEAAMKKVVGAPRGVLLTRYLSREVNGVRRRDIPGERDSAERVAAELVEEV